VAIDVFLSVGRSFTDQQREFVDAVEDRLDELGLHILRVPSGPGIDAPLKPVLSTMKQCCGTVVIAFERTYIHEGAEMRGGGDEKPLSESTVATPWNQIEAALGYSLDHPLLVIIEDGLRREGLIDTGYDWYVQATTLDPGDLRTKGGAATLEYWRDQVVERSRKSDPPRDASDDGPLSFGELLNRLRPGQAWSLMVAALAALVAAFGFGAQFGG
jgi:hypothetical protein